MAQKEEPRRIKCIDCGKRKPLSQFYRSQFHRSGHNPRCKDCYDQWQEDSFDELFAASLGTYVPTIEITISNSNAVVVPKTRVCKWCGTEFEVEHKSQLYCSPDCKAQSVASTRFIILRRDGFRCVYCGARPLDNEDVKLHVDHIVPRDADGPDIADNLVTACQRCNLEKSARRLGEFEAELLSAVAKRNKEQGLDGNMYIKVGK